MRFVYGYTWVLRALIVLLSIGYQPHTSGSAIATGEPEHSATDAAPQDIQRIELRLNQPVSVAGLELDWLELSDSRCPMGVQCFRAGEAKVTIKVNEVPGGQEDQIIVLSTARQKGTATAFGRKFQLLRVDPYPVIGATPTQADHCALVEIQRAKIDG